MKITIDEVLAFGPCTSWTRERMLIVSGNRGSVNVNELSDLDIPAPNLVWLTQKILGSRNRRMLAAALAEQVLPLYERQYPGDYRPRNAIRAARLYALGEIDDTILRDVRTDAWCAARAATRPDAIAAAWSAVWSTAIHLNAAEATAEVAVQSATAANIAAWSTAAAAEADAWNIPLDEQRQICKIFLYDYASSTETINEEKRR